MDAHRGRRAVVSAAGFTQVDETGPNPGEGVGVWMVPVQGEEGNEEPAAGVSMATGAEGITNSGAAALKQLPVAAEGAEA